MMTHNENRLVLKTQFRFTVFRCKHYNNEALLAYQWRWQNSSTKTSSMELCIDNHVVTLCIAWVTSSNADRLKKSKILYGEVQLLDQTYLTLCWLAWWDTTCKACLCLLLTRQCDSADIRVSSCRKERALSALSSITCDFWSSSQWQWCMVCLLGHSMMREVITICKFRTEMPLGWSTMVLLL